MQTQTVQKRRDNQTLVSVINIGFAVLWKCTLFFDELEKYDKMSKAIKRKDRWQEY